MLSAESQSSSATQYQLSLKLCNTLWRGRGETFYWEICRKLKVLSQIIRTTPSSCLLWNTRISMFATPKIDTTSQQQLTTKNSKFSHHRFLRIWCLNQIAKGTKSIYRPRKEPALTRHACMIWIDPNLQYSCHNRERREFKTIDQTREITILLYWLNKSISWKPYRSQNCRLYSYTEK